MNSASNKIIFGKSELHYTITGRGKTPLLAFHGFGQNSSYYEAFGKNLGDLYTVYSFDLFYHGNSFWHSRSEPLRKSDWKNIIEHFLDQHGIQKFVVSGFSMGGKFTLATIEAFSERIQQIIFIAPDGIKTLFWYNLATYPGAFQKYFRAMIVRPKYFYKLLKTVNRLGLVHKSVLKFANSQMDTRKKRRRVYYTWVIFRLLKFNMKRIAELINEKKIPTYMSLGTYDRIITQENMMVLLKELEDYEMILLKKGHNTLIEDTAQYFAKAPEKLRFKQNKQ